MDSSSINLSGPSVNLFTLGQQKQHAVVGNPTGKNNFFWFVLNPLPSKMSFCGKLMFQKITLVAKRGSV